MKLQETLNKLTRIPRPSQREISKILKNIDKEAFERGREVERYLINKKMK